MAITAYVVLLPALVGRRAGSEEAHGAAWAGRESSGSCYLEWRQLMLKMN